MKPTWKLFTLGAIGLSLLTSCEPANETNALAPENPTPAARVSIPMDPNSLAPWAGGADVAITYYLNIPNAADKASFREAFKEWSVALSNWTDHFRFVETSDADNARLRINSSSSATQVGCTGWALNRFCDLNWKQGSGFNFWIGRLMGVPASATAGDVMNPASGNSLFTASDFQNIAYAYGRSAGETYDPIFDVKYYNYSGYETVIGWESLRSRSKPGPVYVTLSTRNLVGMAIKNIPEPGYYATYPLNTYLYATTYGVYKHFAFWPFQSMSVPYGLSGTDAAPGHLGDNSCPDTRYTPILTPSAAPNATTGYRIFAYNPATVGIYWGNGRFSQSLPQFQFGAMAPLYFYRDPIYGSWRVANVIPAGTSCWRLGGYSPAVQ